MFNIGGGEMLVILLLALIVLGPQRLPDAARQIGKFMGELRRMSSGFQNELRSALDDPTEAAARERGARHRPPTAPPADDPGAATDVPAAAIAAATNDDGQAPGKPAGTQDAAKKAAGRNGSGKKAAAKKAAAKKAAPRKRNAPLRAAGRPDESATS